MNRRDLLVENLQESLVKLGKRLEAGTSDLIYVHASLKRFEITYYILQKMLQITLCEREGINAKSPKQVLREAYALEWIHDEQLWLDILEDKHSIIDAHEDKKAMEIYNRIPKYYEEFKRVREKICLPG